MAQNRQIEIGSYPLPDPAWDYARLWDFLYQAKGDLEKLIIYAGEIEEATPESDSAIGIQLEAIAATVAESLKTIKRD